MSFAYFSRQITKGLKATGLLHFNQYEPNANTDKLSNTDGRKLIG